MKKKIINWIRQVLRETKAKGVVLGVSGGVDSAVVASLCTMALGRKRVLALILPCHSNKDDAYYAKKVIKKLGIRYKYIDLSGVYDKLVSLLPKTNKLALSNLKPRLRMMALYYFANSFNYLVVGTGNRSELTVGYFTKYGDGGVDILPIGRLLKCQVYRLAKELDVPKEIISRTPTAGLWAGQTDEGEMGITYKKLDKILKQYNNIKKIPNKKVRKMAVDALHKLSPPLLP